MSKPLQKSRRNWLKSGGFGMLALTGISVTGVVAKADATVLQPEIAEDYAFMERAEEMRRQAVAAGDQAYGAVVVRERLIVGQSRSRVVTHQDPTAHAEMEAIRDAVRRIGHRDLSGCILYSTSHPCPMCEAAAYWAGVDRMIHGKSLVDGGQPTLC